MARVEDVRTVREMASRAFDRGASLTSAHAVRWDIAGRCLNPRSLTVQGRPTRRPLPAVGFTSRGWRYWNDQGQRYLRDMAVSNANAPIWLDVIGRCRRCPECLKQRGLLWRSRIVHECRAAARNWFGTLTLTPHEHYLAECRAAVDFGPLTDEEKFLARHRAITPLVTNYVKRIRKSVPGLRIVAVTEPHKTGLPHYHVVLHEPHASAGKATHRLLTQQWTHGFSKWKLVADADLAAAYVAKYLFKSAGARVRASVRYGEPFSATARAGRPEGIARNEVKRSERVTGREDRHLARRKEGESEAESSGKCRTNGLSEEKR